MTNHLKTKISSDAAETVAVLANDLIKKIRELSEIKEEIFIALSGGSTPQLLFRIIADNYEYSTDWKRLHFFWVDERCVPPESDESNFGVANRLLFKKIDIPSENLHPVRGEKDPFTESKRYAGEIKQFVPFIGGIPSFDIIILGMGEDGHTASIFPAQTIDTEESNICGVSTHPQSRQQRISLTEETINNGGEIVFLVTGANKARIVNYIMKKGPEACFYPAGRIIPVNGRLSWYLDQAAASEMNQQKNEAM